MTRLKDTEEISIQLNPDHGQAKHQLTIIEALGPYPTASFGSYSELIAEFRASFHFPNRNEPITLAILLGLLTKSDGRFSLSNVGRVLFDLKPPARVDALHFLLLTAWSPSSRGSLGVSWTYRKLCHDFWERRSVQFTPGEARAIVANILGLASAQFPNARHLSYRPDSVRGIRRWLEALEPAVMEGDVFRRREVCSPELLMLAIGQVAREDGSQIGTELLLTPERRAKICRICLIEPAVLDRRLDQAMPRFPHLVVPGTRAGSYGRFLRLVAEPTVTSLYPER